MGYEPDWNEPSFYEDEDEQELDQEFDTLEEMEIPE